MSSLIIASRRNPVGLWLPPPISAGIVWDTTPLATFTQTSGTYDYNDLNIYYTGTDPTQGCFKNTGSGTAVHRFFNCRFKSKSHIGYSTAPAGFEFYNCIGTVEDPVVDGQAWGNWLTPVCNWLVMENCTMQDMGGIRLNTTNLNYMRLRYNKALNMSGYKSNGTGGAGRAGARVPTSHTDTANFVRTSFIQLNGITAGNSGAGAGTGGTSRSEYGWNYIKNQPLASLPTDVFSTIGGGGVSGGYLWNHHNYIDGLYFYNPATQYNSARAIQHEPSGGGYIDVEDNTIVRCHGAIEINGGNSNMNIRRNKMWFSFKYNGVQPTYPERPYPYVALAAGTGINQVWADNEYYFWNKTAYVYTLPLVENFANSGNSLGTGWVYGTSVCTEADEAAQEAVWLAAFAAANPGETLGSTLLLA